MAEVKEAPTPKTENGNPKGTAVAGRTPAAPRPAVGSPFSFIRRFAEEMDQLLEDFGLERGMHLPSVLTRGHELFRREAGLVPADWSPKVNILERDGWFVVRADLPGLGKDDVKVEVTDALLTIRGEREHEKEDERKGYLYSECHFGSFYRAVPLPEGVDSSKATAEFRNGVLEVAMPSPKLAAQQARQLVIKEGK